MDVVDPIAIHKARGAVKKRLAREFATELKERYDELTAAMEGAEFKVDAESLNITIEPIGGSDHPTVTDLVSSIQI